MLFLVLLLSCTEGSKRRQWLSGLELASAHTVVGLG
jgi:hypothetical protein